MSELEKVDEQLEIEIGEDEEEMHNHEAEGFGVGVDKEDQESASSSSMSDHIDDIHTPLESFSPTAGGGGRRRSSFTVDSLDASVSSFASTGGETDFPGVTVDAAMLEGEAGAPAGGARARRRSSVSIKSIESFASSRSADSDQKAGLGRRRTNIGIPSFGSDSTGDAESFSMDDSSSNNVRRSLTRSRRSTRRASVNLGSVKSSTGSSMGKSSLGLGAAAEAIGRTSNSEWEDVAAAASIVAGSGQRTHTLFSVKEKVLVFLSILNITNRDDDHEDFTVNPVNKHGFPQGGGKSFDEQRGPYNYVLCTVLKVHFDEDDRYYTVERADTGSEQRADAAWMEPIMTRQGQEEAAKAAQQTGRFISLRDTTEKKARGCTSDLKCIKKCFYWITRVLLPFYRKVRLAAKEQLTHVLQGDTPFACRLRLTGINALVLCSFIYLFIEVIQYSFCHASWDYTLTIIALIAWSILLLELFFEWAIRPSDYFAKIMSDKAYAPSTARHINRFHLFSEFIALLLFIPHLSCIATGECGKDVIFTTLDASLKAILGPTRAKAVFGRFVIGLSGFRFVGLVRHWKQMWLNHTFTDEEAAKNYPFLHDLLIKPFVPNAGKRRLRQKLRGRTEDDEEDNTVTYNDHSKPQNEEDQGLKKAATIGTSLMVVNSHRAMVLLISIMTLLPMILVIRGVNLNSPNAVDLLQQNNVDAGDDCNYLFVAILSWLRAYAVVQTNSRTRFDEDTYVLWAQVLPVRCPDFQDEDGVITTCPEGVLTQGSRGAVETCEFWSKGPTDAADATPEFFADLLDIRVGGISDITADNVTNPDGSDFFVRVMFNENNVVTLTNFTLFLLLLCFLVFTLCGLTVLRGDARRLVLDPLQRMLKIVIRYAENPLARTPRQRSESRADGLETVSDKKLLGNYETEQLINAITKIADLLRKCWGIAGADIISSNLARNREGKTVVFNQTAKGKRVYALFGFVAINGFSEQLRALDRDVMILINDVAKVVHDEVFRWALGDSGQCNKNLGGSFLMVYRIGDFEEVRERQKRATDVVFEAREKGIRKKTSNLRRRGGHSSRGPAKGRGHSSRDRRSSMDDDTLALASLPGIQSFTDRALLGMLKAFAGLHRDREVQKWCKDFRLGAGVGAFAVEIMIGMDAGWAVEGAVGSEYKIDATYLSPHVNMASRMMTATQQYGVTILMSQAVEELLSLNARSKLRHLDTVYVKGSQVKQRIFTYDARHAGVDFFLFDKSEELADQDSENYTQQIWDLDQDLTSMRQHVTEKFKKKFQRGKDQYLSGQWKAAIETLKEADDIMITTVLEEGYIDYNPDDIDPRIFDRKNVSDEILRIRQDLGDGACKTLIKYMENRGGVPPPEWDGVRPLTSK